MDTIGFEDDRNVRYWRTAVARILLTPDPITDKHRKRRVPEFSCWFCGETIEEDDVKAVHIEVSNLWFVGEDQPTQTLWAHSECAKTKLSHMYRFDPDDLINPQ
ncbi:MULTISPECIES: hypothetical protein [unclassified Rhizobium]|uniref:hypothetical protein n=1 Tax=unclassified Rhizobium TaxID=2613769 RepID=UPI000AB2083B|nr:MULTISPECIES: hypothetical protein [unclassified Rhizobium]